MSFSSSITPNGTGILFSSHRPRGYWIHQNEHCAADDLLNDLKSGVWGERLDSVTGILGVLDKPALPWWGMKIGVEGVLELARDGHVDVTEDDVETVVKSLTQYKLTVNHVRDKAGARGLKAHEAFETWANTGILPDPRGFPEDQRPFVEGLVRFFGEAELSHVSTEVMVASRTYRYAGRYDLRCKLNGVPSIVDLKTSKRVYASHFLQMEGYEGASVECGWKPSEERIVVHCREGGYELLRSQDVTTDGEPCTLDDFLSVLNVKRAVTRLGGL